MSRHFGLGPTVKDAPQPIDLIGVKMHPGDRKPGVEVYYRPVHHVHSTLPQRYAAAKRQAERFPWGAAAIAVFALAMVWGRW